MSIILKPISIAYIILFAGLSIFQNKLKISKTQNQVLFTLFAFSLSVIAYCMSPPNGWDITVHSILMDQIRQSGISFFDFVFVNKSSIGSRGYADLLSFNILRYIAIKISDNNYILPAICTFICYSIIGYIAIDWREVNGKGSNITALSMLLCFSFLEYGNVISGMRNGLAACILGLAIYLYLYKKKRIYIFIVLCFIAATIHPAALITIPFVIIAKFDIGIIGYISVFVASAIAQTVAKWLTTSDILYFRIVGQKYFSYTSEDQYRASRAPLYTVLILIVIFLVVYFVGHFRKRSNNVDRSRDLIYNFLAVYMVYILGNIGNYDMVLRPAYVLGPLSPILCSLIVDNTQWTQSRLDTRTKSIVRLISLICCYTLGIYLQYKFAVAYLRYII